MPSESLARRSSAADAEVVAASISEPERFSEIFERHFAVIHAYLARRIGSELADDLAAQVFTVAFERRRTFRPEAQSALPWLYGIATNLMRSHRRNERRLLAPSLGLATRGQRRREKEAVPILVVMRYASPARSRSSTPISVTSSCSSRGQDSRI